MSDVAKIRADINKRGLKTVMKEHLNIPDEDFDSHCSDLYVICTSERQEWLKKNYEFYTNIVLSYSNVDGQSWLGKSFFDIPFAHIEYY